MQVILNILSQSTMDPNATLLLVVILLLIPALPFLRRKVKLGKGPALRPLSGYAAVQNLIGQSIETGRPIHISVGVQGIGQQSTAQTLAGLTTLEYLAQQTAMYDVSPLVSVADGTALAAAQDVLRRASAAHGQGKRLDPYTVRMIAPEPVAYASGVMGLLSREQVWANVMNGAFGDEYLLMGETGVRKDLQQVAGSANPQALPFMMVAANHVLIGEEMFAAGAYLAGIAGHIASLILQDWMRTIIILLIVVGVVLKTVL